jgi:hypothetical protein
VRHRVAGSDRDGVNARQVREYKDRTIRPLAGIQILRAVAALGVVIHHMQSELIQRGFDNPFPDFEVGAFGVDLFFVISGFIMVYSSGRFFARPDGGRRFFLKRLIRIVPLYWLFTTLLVFIAIRGTWHTGAYSVKEFIASYLFIPAPDRLGLMIPTYPPGWTLNYEMFFYVCFASALRWSRPIAVSLVVSALTALVILGYMVALPQPIAFWTDSLCLEFCYGIGLALLFLRGWRIRPLVRLALLITGAIAAVAFPGRILADPRLRVGIARCVNCRRRSPHGCFATQPFCPRVRVAWRCIIFALSDSCPAIHLALSSRRENYRSFATFGSSLWIDACGRFCCGGSRSVCVG